MFLSLLCQVNATIPIPDVITISSFAIIFAFSIPGEFINLSNTKTLFLSFYFFNTTPFKVAGLARSMASKVKGNDPLESIG